MSYQQNNSLFVVATPIGNLQDITVRALDVLRSVDLVVSENVGKTRNLLKHYGIKTKVSSYREANSRRVIPSLIGMLKSGRGVALVAEAGTPGVSDPGRRLVREVMRQGLRVVPVPGASAAIAAVSVSGLDDARFIFEGFLPRRGSKRRERLRELAGAGPGLVLFEAPHRLVGCLKDMLDILGDRECIVAREITKLHEEVERGSIASFVEKYEKAKPRGEFVIVCEGGRAGGGPAVSPEALLKEAGALARKGARKKEIAKALGKKHGIPGRDVYRIITRGTLEKDKED